jgi:hypothetical protein
MTHTDISDVRKGVKVARHLRVLAVGGEILPLLPLPGVVREVLGGPLRQLCEYLAKPPRPAHHEDEFRTFLRQFVARIIQRK